ANVVESPLYDWLKLVPGSRALVPRFEHHSRDYPAGRVDLEHMIGLRIFLHDLEDLFRVQHLLLQRGVGREGRRCNHDALVLLRRELALGTGIEKIDAGQHEESKGRCHGQIVEAVVQPPKIEMAYALESAIDECGE